MDVSYVDDVVAAHLNALDALATQPQQVGGQAYFISQDQPVYLWDWLNCILSGLGHPPLKRRVPLPIAYAAGSACELLWGLLRKRSDPPMTRFVAVELAKSHYFDISAPSSNWAFVRALIWRLHLRAPSRICASAAMRWISCIIEQLI